MFEKYIIVTEPSKNIIENGATTGFQFSARLPYYRGLGISMVEDIVIKVDGRLVPSKKIQVELHGNTYSLKQMETEANDLWEFGEVGIIKVLQAGGLTQGSHEINLLFNIRVSYMPVNALRQDTKQIIINN